MEEKDLKETNLDFEDVKEEMEQEQNKEKFVEQQEEGNFLINFGIDDESIGETDNFDIDYEAEEQEILRQIKEEKKSNFRKKIIALVAILLAISAAVTGCITLKKKNKKPNDKEPVAITTTLDEEDKISIDDLGETINLEEQTKTPEEIYSNPTGNVEPEKIVEKDDVLFVDQDAADNKDKVGETSIDLQDGKLEVTPEGTVVEKDKTAEIKTPEGTIVTEKIDPNTNLPEGFVKDEELDKIVEKEDVNKGVYVDQDYYRISDGELLYAKGEIVTKEALEAIKNDKTLTTVKPVIETKAPETTPETTTPETTPETTTPETTTPETTTPENPSNIDSLGGVINSNGTYTIYGVTYMDKATFEAFVMDENAGLNFGFYNGVVYPIEVIKEMSNQKSR